MEPDSESGPEYESVLTAPVPLPTKMPESVLEPVPPLPTPRMPDSLSTPIEVVATIDPSAFVERIAFVRFVIAKEVEVACESVTFPVNVFAPLQVLMSERSVEDAALIVIELPRAKLVPLIVPREPEINPEPMVVVETTRPFSLVASKAFVNPVR